MALKASTAETVKCIRWAPHTAHTLVETLTLTVYQLLNEACFVQLWLVGSFHCRVQKSWHTNTTLANIHCADSCSCDDKHITTYYIYLHKFQWIKLSTTGSSNPRAARALLLKPGARFKENASVSQSNHH